MYFGVETINRAESEHSVLKLWLSTCHGDLDTVFLNINSLIEGQIANIKASLEFSMTKEKFNAKSNQIFFIISTGLISKVREICSLAKGVLGSIFLEDPGVTLTSSLEVLGQDPVGEGDRHELLGEGAEGATMAENVIGDGNYGYRVVTDFVFGDEHQWPELGSTTLLPLYSYSDCPGGTLVIGLLIEQQHFIQLQIHDGCPIPLLHLQWIHHRTERVCNWADSYQERIADWKARVARNRK
ncbi:hypothetical protein M9H77_02187 [Catharanthus roseus]|uniref:Uncharacterized protein n=1 Tax=Catharanthus roseus TaxID=4058 RepID=A0ACC0C7N7_CATRO|nr:hypothetical protein M9H77_02187 [Catharanthus roseus]